MARLCSAIVDDRGDVLHTGSDKPVIWWSFTKTLIAAVFLPDGDTGAAEKEVLACFLGRRER